jgi:hypothetical protein
MTSADQFLMDPNVSTLERAFALAASGRFSRVSDIRLHLHREGYNYEMVQGPVLFRQLTEAMEQAHQRVASSARSQKMVPGKKLLKVPREEKKR